MVKKLVIISAAVGPPDSSSSSISETNCASYSLGRTPSFRSLLSEDRVPEIAEASACKHPSVFSLRTGQIRAGQECAQQQRSEEKIPCIPGCLGRGAVLLQRGSHLSLEGNHFSKRIAMPGMIAVVICSGNRCAIKTGWLSVWPTARALTGFEHLGRC